MNRPANTEGSPAACALPPLIVSATGSTRVNLALHHLLAACRFAAQVGHVEREHDGETFGEFWDEILHYSLGVATLTVAALESYANEHLADGALSSTSINAAASDSIGRIIDREAILSKFDLILRLRTGQSLDFGSRIAQCVDLLIKVRNAVVHFKPEWHDAAGAHSKLSAQLAGRFSRSPYLQGEDFFPTAWASHSFSSWALQSTVAFLEHFEQAAEIRSKLAPFRARMSRLSAGAV